MTCPKCHHDDYQEFIPMFSGANDEPPYPESWVCGWCDHTYEEPEDAGSKADYLRECRNQE